MARPNCIRQVTSINYIYIYIYIESRLAFFFLFFFYFVVIWLIRGGWLVRGYLMYVEKKRTMNLLNEIRMDIYGMYNTYSPYHIRIILLL